MEICIIICNCGPLYRLSCHLRVSGLQNESIYRFFLRWGLLLAGLGCLLLTVRPVYNSIIGVRLARLTKSTVKRGYSKIHIPSTTCKDYLSVVHGVDIAKSVFVVRLFCETNHQLHSLSLFRSCVILYRLAFHKRLIINDPIWGIVGLSDSYKATSCNIIKQYCTEHPDISISSWSLVSL